MMIVAFVPLMKGNETFFENKYREYSEYSILFVCYFEGGRYIENSTSETNVYF